MQRGKNYGKKGVSGVKLAYHWQGKNIMDFGSTADPDPFGYLSFCRIRICLDFIPYPNYYRGIMKVNYTQVRGKHTAVRYSSIYGIQLQLRDTATYTRHCYIYAETLHLRGTIIPTWYSYTYKIQLHEQ
jgi:hypothetical protein